MAPKKIRLTRKRLQWAEPRKATLKGERLPSFSGASAAKYDAQLSKLVTAMRKEYNAEIRKLFRTHADEASVLAMDASLASQARILFNFLGSKWAKAFASRSAGMTERMIDGASMASKRALGESLKKISGGITIKVPTMPAALQEQITAATAENVGLIKSIQQQYHERISQLVLRSAATGGRGAEEIFEQIKHYDGLTEKRANLIAVDQTRKITTAMNVERAKSVGMKRWEWVHSGGGADPRRLHVKYDGQIFDYDNPPIIDERTGERGFPGQLINCHPGETLVKSFSAINKLYRSLYSGELVVLVSDDGVVLKATPNHPVLTDSGWKAIKDVNLGDYLFHAVKHGSDLLESDVKNANPKFVEFFEAASLFVGINRADASGTGLEFHGDITDEKIEVIDINGGLSNVLDSFACEAACKLILSWADENAHTFALGDCSPAKLVMRSFGFPDGLIGSLGSALTILKGGFAGADDARLALCADIDSKLLEPEADNIPGHSVIFGQLKLAYAAGVFDGDLLCREFLSACSQWLAPRDFKAISAESLGEIIGVDSKLNGDLPESLNAIKKGFRVREKGFSEYSGHVYNLETDSGWYDANGIITHNCRCTMVPVLELGDAEDTQ